MTIDSYIIQRLIKARYTSFTNDQWETESICTSDGNARLSPSHTLPHKGAMCFSNMNHRHYEDFTVEDGMVEFYRNSIIAGEPMVADTIICNERFQVPEFDRYPGDDRTQWIPTKLRKLVWDAEGWLIFNSGKGLLSDKWWHIYGNLPN